MDFRLLIENTYICQKYHYDTGSLFLRKNGLRHLHQIEMESLTEKNQVESRSYRERGFEVLLLL